MFHLIEFHLMSIIHDFCNPRRNCPTLSDTKSDPDHPRPDAKHPAGQHRRSNGHCGSIVKERTPVCEVWRGSKVKDKM